MRTGARISAALGMSLALHGAALAVMDRLPRGGRGEDAAGFGAGVLQARLRESMPVVAAFPAKPVGNSAKTSKIGVPLPAAQQPRGYYPVSELDEKPQIRSSVEPEFPADAPVKEGRVVLRLHIGETGEIDEITVLKAEPAAVFDEAALRAFTGAEFTPGRKNGIAVKSALSLELLFGAPLPLAHAKPAEGQLWQPLRRARPNPPSRKEKP